MGKALQNVVKNPKKSARQGVHLLVPAVTNVAAVIKAAHSVTQQVWIR